MEVAAMEGGCGGASSVVGDADAVDASSVVGDADAVDASSVVEDADAVDASSVVEEADAAPVRDAVRLATPSAHRWWVNAIGFNPDGRTLAVGGADPTSLSCQVTSSRTPECRPGALAA
jgi:hypothetical protein